MSEWQLIESASKDGRWLIVFEPFDSSLGQSEWIDVVRWAWVSDSWGPTRQEWVDTNGDVSCQHPTHWMPLPNPPQPNKAPDGNTEGGK